MTNDSSPAPMSDQVKSLMIIAGLSEEEAQKAFAVLGSEIERLGEYNDSLGRLRESAELDPVIIKVAVQLAADRLGETRTESGMRGLGAFYYQLLMAVIGNAIYAGLVYLLFKLIERTSQSSVLHFRTTTNLPSNLSSLSSLLGAPDTEKIETVSLILLKTFEPHLSKLTRPTPYDSF